MNNRQMLGNYTLIQRQANRYTAAAAAAAAERRTPVKRAVGLLAEQVLSYERILW
jgi:hypothetical protein